MADAFDDEAEQTVTMGEFIQDLEAAELEADLVLGGDDGEVCTYGSGYVKRQAVFSCLTCVPGGSAGVCTACSLACHDGHEIVELWTKRNFRCDCGNSNFGQFPCKLLMEKDPLNSKNKYNQNFQGLYCTCHRPYPDPEAEEQVEMIQCCICEDWFHESHIGLDSHEEVPTDGEGEPLYEDFICQNCASTISFLQLYPSSVLALSKQSSMSINSSQDKSTSSGSTPCDPSESIGNGISCSGPGSSMCPVSSVIDEKEVPSDGNVEVKVSSDGRTASPTNAISEGAVPSSENGDTKKCLLGINIREANFILEKIKPLFLCKKWRQLLCKCETCCGFYAEKGVEYLIDKEDSMEEYEKIAQQKREEKLQKQEGAEQTFINTLNHVQKIEIFNGIADMKNELANFMESFDSSKPITAEDVHGIFENLAKKRQRLQ